MVLLGAHGEAEPEDASDEQPGLSSLLSPGHLPEVGFPLPRLCLV